MNLLTMTIISSSWGYLTIICHIGICKKIILSTYKCSLLFVAIESAIGQISPLIPCTC